MELEIAIELNKKSIESLEKHNFKANAQAVALGNEALKGLQALRRGKGHSLAELLPGETKGEQNG